MTETGFVYGHALFELAQEEGKLEAYLEQINMVCFILDTVPKLLPLLACHGISMEERLSVLDDGFGGQVEPYVLNFMKVLVNNGHAEELPNCIEQFKKLCDEEKGILSAKVVSAIPLPPALKEKLQEKLSAITGKTIVLMCKEDASVIGGLQVDLGGKELDGTLRRRLDEFGKELKELVL
jgi:F-type H+-transporting ATPase subunit delta